jgi:hypothetical protein
MRATGSIPWTKRFVLPSFGSENFRIRSINVFTPMHGMDTGTDILTFPNEYWMLAICSSALGKHSVFYGHEPICWDWRVESKH